MKGKNGVRYSKEQKEAIVKRMMPPHNESVANISKEEGITEVTLEVFDQSKQLTGALKEEQKRAKQLEKDLLKKEKALAEAAALLLLRKKAQAIWGGRRGKMISPSNRALAVELILEANQKRCAVTEGL